jgi:hypothetical protein
MNSFFKLGRSRRGVVKQTGREQNDNVFFGGKLRGKGGVCILICIQQQLLPILHPFLMLSVKYEQI